MYHVRMCMRVYVSAELFVHDSLQLHSFEKDGLLFLQALWQDSPLNNVACLLIGTDTDSFVLSAGHPCEMRVSHVVNFDTNADLACGKTHVSFQRIGLPFQQALRQDALYNDVVNLTVDADLACNDDLPTTAPVRTPHSLLP